MDKQRLIIEIQYFPRKIDLEFEFYFLPEWKFLYNIFFTVDNFLIGYSTDSNFYGDFHFQIQRMMMGTPLSILLLEW